ncbi:hypothetical protein A11A3_13465 [Alcanivorax hongdengensis A-11-3]|uniref:N-acetyltransferase domain-containing protein n=1 Tax=Alcanivorax hongdengensis A-11-3 TaxID=1177179 RepID=L0W950_9GAMM|nr:hypothetical protein [Alcanivorax hongdengensis]EKF73456.1 hypothetical protein A11A3_13465 [Alcanivorax hongdengensis A-11-3]
MSFVIRPAQPDDNEAILSLLEGTPQQGAVTLNFERRPDYFRGARVTCEEPDVWVAEPRDTASKGPIGAVYNVGWRRLWVNGEVRNIRYAHDLRIAVSCRNGTLLHRMFRKLRNQLAPGEWMQTTVLRDNQASMSTVASGRAGLPTYYPFGTIETSLIYTRARRARLPEGWSIRRTGPYDRPAVARLLREEGSKKQFFPYWHLDRQQGDPFCFGMGSDQFLGLWEGEELRGLLGFWDQRDIKQTRVLAYRKGLRVLRHVYNTHSRLRGGLRLPPPGGVLSYLTLHSIVVADNEPRRLQALLDHAVECFHGRYDALVCGFFSQDPLARVAAGYRRQRLLSDHFLVSYEGDPREQLDSTRLPYVDVARL